MMDFLVLIVFSLNVNIPDSIFSPTNAIRIPPPKWKVVLELNDTNFIELGYHTDFKLKWNNLFASLTEECDYQPYDKLQNEYFMSTPYFSISHHAYGIYRNKSNISTFMMDTVDFFFSFDRFVPDITFLPRVHYFRKNSETHMAFTLPVSFSVVYSGASGILTYGGIERVNLLSKDASGIYRIGIGIMSSKKFVSLGLTSYLVPEFNLRALLINGMYIDAHFGYDHKTPDIFSYLYPDAIGGDTALEVMEKRLSVLIDKSPFLISFTYSVPDTFFEKSIKLDLSFRTRYIDVMLDWFNLYKKPMQFLYLRLENKAISKVSAEFHVPLMKSLTYNPYVDVYEVDGYNSKVYNIGGVLRWGVRNFQFFWVHNLLNKGEILALRPDNGDFTRFFEKRRFRIGARYSF